MRRAIAVLSAGSWPADAAVGEVTLAFYERHRRRITTAARHEQTQIRLGNLLPKRGRVFNSGIEQDQQPDADNDFEEMAEGVFDRSRVTVERARTMLRSPPPLSFRRVCEEESLWSGVASREIPRPMASE